MKPFVSVAEPHDDILGEDYLEDAGFDRVHWQTLRADLKKLNIGFRTYKGAAQCSATIYIDLRMARRRAVQRGLIRDQGVPPGTCGENDNPGLMVNDELHVGQMGEKGPENTDDFGVEGPEDNVEAAILRRLRRATDDLGVGVGTLIRDVSSEEGVDTDTVRDAMMRLTREGRITEHILGYYKILED